MEQPANRRPDTIAGAAGSLQKWKNAKVIVWLWSLPEEVGTASPDPTSGLLNASKSVALQKATFLGKRKRHSHASNVGQSLRADEGGAADNVPLSSAHDEGIEEEMLSSGYEQDDIVSCEDLSTDYGDDELTNASTGCSHLSVSRSEFEETLCEIAMIVKLKQKIADVERKQENSERLQSAFDEWRLDSRMKYLYYRVYLHLS